LGRTGDYVLVTSADESAAKAKELGATVVAGPFDVQTHGRMAVIQDPTGAVIALWQPNDHEGAGVVNVANSFCWNELMTTDILRLTIAMPRARKQRNWVAA